MLWAATVAADVGVVGGWPTMEPLAQAVFIVDDEGGFGGLHRINFDSQ